MCTSPRLEVKVLQGFGGAAVMGSGGLGGAARGVEVRLRDPGRGTVANGAELLERPLGGVEGRELDEIGGAHRVER